MSDTAQRLKDELAQLSDEDRAELAYFLVSSLPASPDDEFDSAFDEELMRRGDEIRSGKVIGVPYASALKMLREKYS